MPLDRERAECPWRLLIELQTTPLRRKFPRTGRCPRNPHSRAGLIADALGVLGAALRLRRSSLGERLILRLLAYRRALPLSKARGCDDLPSGDPRMLAKASRWLAPREPVPVRIGRYQPLARAERLPARAPRWLPGSYAALPKRYIVRGSLADLLLGRGPKWAKLPV